MIPDIGGLLSLRIPATGLRTQVLCTSLETAEEELRAFKVIDPAAQQFEVEAIYIPHPFSPRGCGLVMAVGGYWAWVIYHAAEDTPRPPISNSGANRSSLSFLSYFFFTIIKRENSAKNKEMGGIVGEGVGIFSSMKE